MEMYTKVSLLVALLAVVAVTARPSGDDTKKDEAPRFTRTTSYHGANTRSLVTPLGYTPLFGSIRSPPLYHLQPQATALQADSWHHPIYPATINYYIPNAAPSYLNYKHHKPMVNLFTIENGQLVSSIFDNRQHYIVPKTQVPVYQKPQPLLSNAIPLYFKTQANFGSDPNEHIELLKTSPNANVNATRTPLDKFFSPNINNRQNLHDSEITYLQNNQNIGAGFRHVQRFGHLAQNQDTQPHNFSPVNIARTPSENAQLVKEYKNKVIQELNQETPLTVPNVLVVSSNPDEPVAPPNPDVDVFAGPEVGRDDAPITRLVLKPVAKAQAGTNGTAIARPISHAVIREGENVDIDFDPVATAIVGPGGSATAFSDLIISIVRAPNNTVDDAK